MAQGCDRPYVVALLGHPQADTGRAHLPILPSTNPGGEHPHIRQAIPSGGIGTHRGRDKVGGTEALEQLLQGPLGGESRAPKVVTRGGTEGGDSGG